MGSQSNRQTDEECRSSAEASIREIMSRNSVLAHLESSLAGAVILGKYHEGGVRSVRHTDGWDEGGLNLVVEYWVETGRMTVISFRIGRFPNGFPTCREHFVVHVESVTETSLIGGGVHFEHLVNPDKDDPLRYGQVFFEGDFGCPDPVFLDLSDMLRRFPTSVELLADRMTLITDSIRPEKDLSQHVGPSAS
jgi:hypothetical protein